MCNPASTPTTIEQSSPVQDDRPRLLCLWRGVSTVAVSHPAISVSAQTTWRQLEKLRSTWNPAPVLFSLFALKEGVVFRPAFALTAAYCAHDEQVLLDWETDGSGLHLKVFINEGFLMTVKLPPSPMPEAMEVLLHTLARWFHISPP